MFVLVKFSTPQSQATPIVFLTALYVYLCINIFNIYLCIPDVYMLIVPCAKLNHKTGEDMLQKHIISHPGVLWFILLNFIASDCVSFWSDCQNNLLIPSNAVLPPIPNGEENILAALAAQIKGKEGRKSVVQRQEFVLKARKVQSVVLTNWSSLIVINRDAGLPKSSWAWGSQSVMHLCSYTLITSSCSSSQFNLLNWLFLNVLY